MAEKDDSWKFDPNLFAKKIIERIEKSDTEVTYTSLQERAIEKGISLDVLDRALEKLHKFKQIKQRVKGDDIVYTVIEKPKPKDPFATRTWLNENYPYPTPCGADGCTGFCKACEPFPEIDLSYIFLKPAEMKEYKAQAKGMPLFMMNKRIQDRIKKVTQ